MVFLPRPRSPTFSRFCWNLPRKSSHSKRKLLLFSVVGGGGLCYLYTNAVQADADLDSRADKNDTTLRSASYTTLLRSYFVYSVCSWPTIVNYSPFIISAATAIPGLKQVAEVVIRHTFFAQFVGGDTAEKTLQVISQLRSNNIGALLAYSVEVDEDQAGRSKFPKSHISAHGYKANVEETIRSIDVAADFEERFRSQSGKRTWVAIKLVELLPFSVSCPPQPTLYRPHCCLRRILLSSFQTTSGKVHFFPEFQTHPIYNFWHEERPLQVLLRMMLRSSRSLM